jgi:dnd system-associated protein 4
MTDRLTIRDAAEKALQKIGRAATIPEIYAEIVRSGLFEFNTQNPEHVLRTTIVRHTENIERGDSFKERISFSLVGDEMYALANAGKTRASKMNSTTGIKRIHRATDKEEIIRLMTSDQLGVFREIWRLLMFAAQIGYRNARRDPLKVIDSGKGIDQSTFGNSPAWPGVMFLISLADAGAAEVLAGTPESEEQRISAFQEYANGGLAVLQEFFSSRPADLDGLLDFIDSQRVSPRAPPDLELSI